ncbi:MAG: hypothetical protein KA957_04630 [Syntrophaceae bacterium]|nr:hypothetical protein [Syntrophaceae bacterium]
MGLLNGFRPARFVATVLACFAFSLLYNALVHLIILAEANAAIAPLRRPDFSSYLGLSIAATFLVCALFVFIYLCLVEKKSFRTGLLFGFCTGLLLAAVVDINAYVLYPLPFSLVWKWAVFGVGEFSLMGLLAAWVLPRHSGGR